MQKRNWRYAKILFVAIAAYFMVGNAMIVHAQRVAEQESNDTVEVAQVIQPCRMTPQQAANADMSGQYVIDGSTDKNDPDWFVVYLTEGTQYFTCNGDALEYEVYDSNMNLISSDQYRNDPLGVTAYPFDVEIAGNYYVKVTGQLETHSNYLIQVGGPTYTVASCTVNLDKVTMADRSDSVVDFDLREVAAIPDNAVVWYISTTGIRTSSVKSVVLINQNSGHRIDCAPYSWGADGLETSNIPLKSKWDIIFGYNKATSFTPMIKFHYIYPVVSHVVRDSSVSQNVR